MTTFYELRFATHFTQSPINDGMVLRPFTRPKNEIEFNKINGKRLAKLESLTMSFLSLSPIVIEDYFLI